MTEAKVMSRSRNQLATSYAPESFFTFEGGLGGCIARSAVGAPITLAEATLDQIFQRIQEIGRAWFDEAMSAGSSDPNRPPVLPEQCVDTALLDGDRASFRTPGQDRIFLCKPSHMEYTPAPLAFVCRTCGLFRDYETLKTLDEELPRLTPAHCPHPKTKGRCDWEQLDVIFVHWSGRWVAPFPGQYQWTERDGNVVARRDRCTCDCVQFELNRRQPAIGDWFFQCASCGKPLSQKWLQNDPLTLRIIGSAMTEQRRTEVRMEVTPYRASSAYYVKSDLFIDFKDGGHDLLARLRPGREEALMDFIATRYGFGTVVPTDAEVEAACAGREDCERELMDYRAAIRTLRAAEESSANIPELMRPMMEAALETARNSKQRIIDELRRREILVPQVSLPGGLIERLRNRQAFASKFDPFRLSVEHATLEATRLGVERRVGGRKPYVSFTKLDEDLSPETEAERDRLQRETRRYLALLGFADMGLIREFDLCRFSFGYSRVEAGPVLHDKRHMDMPVRLNLFPPVPHEGTFKHPVYVVQQGNEALYLRLEPQAVLRWLQGLECEDMFQLDAGQRLGAGILTVAYPMGPFLDRLPHSDSPRVYLYLYTLLHSYAHLVMKYVSEYSGLDLGSLGEYIFPADLAFVVYRNGTTMDLGNLSALWRNAGTAMLGAMLSHKATQCGTGSLCTFRGGACPDCLMIPEPSCIASNKLLSRSVLRSIGGRPRFDTRDHFVVSGYLDAVDHSAVQ